MRYQIINLLNLSIISVSSSLAFFFTEGNPGFVLGFITNITDGSGISSILLNDFDSEYLCLRKSNKSTFVRHNTISFLSDECKHWNPLIFRRLDYMASSNEHSLDDLLVQKAILSNETRLLHLLSSWESEMTISGEDADDPTLHQMIKTKVHDYADELKRSFNDFLKRIEEYLALPDKDVKHPIHCLFPHPNKVLHFIGPRIPAIRQSPDIMLRIVAADVHDLHLAAYAVACVGVVVQLHELYYRQAKILINATSVIDSAKVLWDEGHNRNHHAVPKDILSDRRFEQLLECALCRMDRGMTVSDIVKTIWGLSAVRYHKSTHKLCDMDPRELMDTLAAQTYELLIQRLNSLHGAHDDFGSEGDQSIANTDLSRRKIYFHSRLKSLSKDVVSTVQAFSSPGWDSSANKQLFPLCIDILHRNINDLWVMEGGESSSLQIEEEDIIDKLAISELPQADNDNMAHQQLFDQTNNFDGFDNEGALLCDILSSEDKKSVLSQLEVIAKSFGKDDEKIYTIIKRLNS